MKRLLTINGTAFEAQKDTYRIGRGADCDILLPEDDQRASRMHARLSLSGEGLWVVADLGSANGTFVNGTKIEKATVLKEGDCIQAGSTEIVLGAPAPQRLQARTPAPSSPAPSAPAAPMPQKQAPAQAGPLYGARPSQESLTTAAHSAPPMPPSSSPTYAGPSHSASPPIEAPGPSAQPAPPMPPTSSPTSAGSGHTASPPFDAPRPSAQPAPPMPAAGGPSHSASPPIESPGPSAQPAPPMPPIPSPALESEIPAFLKKPAKHEDHPEARSPEPPGQAAPPFSSASQPDAPPHESFTQPQHESPSQNSLAPGVAGILAFLPAVGLLISFTLPWFSLPFLGLNLASPNYFQILSLLFDLIRLGGGIPFEAMLALVPMVLLLGSLAALAVKGSGQGILLASVGGLGVVFGAFMISRLGEAVRLAGLGFYLFLFVCLCSLAFGLVRFLMHSKGER